MAAAPASGGKGKRIVLFDVDGTLTPSRQKAVGSTLELLKQLRAVTSIGMVGGSDLSKQMEQLGDDVLSMFDYAFPENGLVAYRQGALISKTSFKDFLGEARLKEFINFVLAYLSTVDIPVKRGTFIEFRTGMLNISPIGRDCSHEERNDFEAYDLVHGVRKTMIAALTAKFGHFGLKYSIGGQISFDVFPIGWDKTFCLPFLKADGFEEIHFFGDKTAEGGNDFEIFSSPLTIGHTTTGPEDTAKQCHALFLA